MSFFALVYRNLFWQEQIQDAQRLDSYDTNLGWGGILRMKAEWQKERY